MLSELPVQRFPSSCAQLVWNVSVSAMQPQSSAFQRTAGPQAVRLKHSRMVQQLAIGTISDAALQGCVHGD